MNNLIGKNVLVTCQSWFYGPDGKSYKAVWGCLKSVNEAAKDLGFIPNRAHANWYLTVSKLRIMGCQAMYVLECPEPPPTAFIPDYQTDGGEFKEFKRPTQVLILEE